MGEMIAESRFSGCMLGGALGDALGYPVRSMNTEGIARAFGKKGITSPAVDKESGCTLISANTQLALFTAEGILWADRLGGKNEISSYTTYVFYAYQRWLYTQEKLLASREYSHVLDNDTAFASRLLREQRLLHRREPDADCITALKLAAKHDYGRLTNRINDNRGYASVVRVAPAGLYFHKDSERAFRMAAEFAAITHTGASGYLSAGVLGALVAELVCGSDIEEALDVATYILKGYDGCMECFRSLDYARSLDASDIAPLEAVKRLGMGETANEALAIALYCALCHSEKPENALLLAANHDGNSAATACICGSIVGAYHGEGALPKKWLKRLELAEVIQQAALALYECAVH